MTRLSIIIPVFNVEMYLRECLDSAIVPEIENYEIVCVNDGSTDNSPVILEEYRERYPELIRIVHTENQGLGAASNNGIVAANGQYIAFLDSDDTLSENAVREMLEACQFTDDLIIFDCTVVTDKGRFLERLQGCNNREEGSFTLEQYPQLLFDRANRWNKLYRKSLFSELGISYPGRVWFEDYWTNLKLYPFCKSIRYVSKAWYNYRQQPNSITHVKNTQRNLEIIDAAESVLMFYEQSGLLEQYNAELEYSVFYNVLLTSIDRVNLIDPKSEVQDQLLSYTKKRFPNYEKNPYFLSMSQKYKLLYHLIKTRKYRVLHTVLKANSIRK